MDGFLNDEQIEEYLAALDHERAGYEQRVAAAKKKSDKVAEKLYSDRIGEVDEEKARIAALVSHESPVDEADAAKA